MIQSFGRRSRFFQDPDPVLQVTPPVSRFITDAVQLLRPCQAVCHAGTTAGYGNRNHPGRTPSSPARQPPHAIGGYIRQLFSCSAVKLRNPQTADTVFLELLFKQDGKLPFASDEHLVIIVRRRTLRPEMVSLQDLHPYVL